MKKVTLACVCIAFAAAQLFLFAALAGQTLIINEEEKGELKPRSNDLDTGPVSTRHLLHTQDPDAATSEDQLPDTYEEWRNTKCANGHIWNLKNVCPGATCLRRIDLKKWAFPLFRSRKRHILERHPLDAVPENVIEDMSYLRGAYNHKHSHLITTLTDLQWIHGLYGSVLEIGVEGGKFSSVLSLNVDHNIGERLVFSDSFKHMGQNINEGDQKNQFLQAMAKRNLTFSDEEESDKKRAYLHKLHPSKLSITELNSMNIPQFRIISINGYGDPLRTFLHLENAICLLRDGGIIVIENSDSELIQKAVSNFLRFIQYPTLTPLISVHNKLYLCTTNWQSKYLELLHKRSIRLGIDIKKAAEVTFCNDKINLTGR